MYTDVIYTYHRPRRGEMVEGVSNRDGDVVVTCPLVAVRKLEPSGGRPVFAATTRHGETFQVIVLPDDLRGATRPGKPLSFRRNRSPRPLCRRPECFCEKEDARTNLAVRVLKEYRWTVTWLALLSLLLGSRAVFITQLLNMFTSLFNSIHIELLKLFLGP